MEPRRHISLHIVYVSTSKQNDAIKVREFYLAMYAYEFSRLSLRDNIKRIHLKFSTGKLQSTLSQTKSATYTDNSLVFIFGLSHVEKTMTIRL